MTTHSWSSISDLTWSKSVINICIVSFCAQRHIKNGFAMKIIQTVHQGLYCLKFYVIQSDIALYTQAQWKLWKHLRATRMLWRFFQYLVDLYWHVQVLHVMMTRNMLTLSGTKNVHSNNWNKTCKSTRQLEKNIPCRQNTE